MVSPLHKLRTAPPLRGLRADTINQKNVIIRLNTLRLHEHTHRNNTICEHEHNVWMHVAHTHIHRVGPVCVCKQGGWVAEVFRGEPGVLFVQKKRKKNALRLVLFIRKVVKQKSVCYSSGWRGGRGWGSGGINTHQCRCLSIYGHPWESLLCSVSNLMSGDPHLAESILVGGFTWAPSKVHICLRVHLYSSTESITIACFLPPHPPRQVVATNKHKDSI